MKMVTLEATVDADGMLRLALPVGLPASKVEVVLVIQPCGDEKRSRETGYEWLLAPQYDNIGRGAINHDEKRENLTHQERAKRIMELLDMALKDVSWDEIAEGRRDRCFSD
jgi:hypothetical protein